MNDNKYATLESGLGFQSITNKLEDSEYSSITPSRVRLILLSTLEKIVRNIAISQGKPLKRDRIKEIVQESGFQNSIAPLIQMAYGEDSLMI